MILPNYIPICDAIVRLLDPLVEIVIHNIQKNNIVYINGKLSGRKMGDLSLLYNLSFDHLTQEHKKALTKHLFELGAFHEKNSADYVAKVLKLGRATIFKYLKEWRKK